MDISINFTGAQILLEDVIDVPRPGQNGVLSVEGQVADHFFSPTDRWGKCDYENQWLEAIQRLRGGATKDCLVTSVHPSHIACFVMVYGVWKVSDGYRIGQLALNTDPGSSGDFDPRRSHEFMPEFATHDEDGEQVQYWTCDAKPTV
jgi:hypothetical protein